MDLVMSSRQDGELTIAEVMGEIDVASAARFRDELGKAVADATSHVVVDMTKVPFLDSTGLGVLVGRLKSMRLRDLDMVLVISDDRLLRSFKITGLDQVFRLFDTVDEALDACR